MNHQSKKLLNCYAVARLLCRNRIRTLEEDVVEADLRGLKLELASGDPKGSATLQGEPKKAWRFGTETERLSV